MFEIILYIFIGWTILSFILMIIISVKRQELKNKSSELQEYFGKQCPPHSWKSDEGGLICSICNKRPGVE